MLAKDVAHVLVPSSAVPGPDGAPQSGALGGDWFSCWEVSVQYGAGAPAPRPTPRRMTIQDAFGERVFDVGKPKTLCVPAEVNGQQPDAVKHLGELVCHEAKLARLRPPQPKLGSPVMSTRNALGREVLTVGAVTTLCLPALPAGASPTPSATPTAPGTPTPTPTATVGVPPPFTLRVHPIAATIGVGEHLNMIAFLDLPDGSSNDVSDRVEWRTSDPAVATAANLPGDPGRIDAVDAGTTTISVFEPGTGISSTDSSGDATLTVAWTLRRIELLPVAVTRGVGESVRLRANGHFFGGVVQPIEQLLTYQSSNLTIAQAVNGGTPDDRSRVVAMGVGEATVSAVDPRSGLSSTTTGDDVRMTVVPAMDRLVITPTTRNTTVGNVVRYTATGHYPGGFERNVTQQVQWSTGDLAIARAPNTAGDRSAIEATGKGVTSVSAFDQVSGTTADCCAEIRVDELQEIRLRCESSSPGSPATVRVPGSWRLVAIGVFPGASSARSRNRCCSRPAIRGWRSPRTRRATAVVSRPSGPGPPSCGRSTARAASRRTRCRCAPWPICRECA